jgi:hypothetical protein
VGVTNVVVALAPGAIGAIVAPDGKHAIGEQPAGRVGYAPQTLTHPTWKPCGTVPLFVSVSVTIESFCVAMMFFGPASAAVAVNPVSLTATSIV